MNLFQGYEGWIQDSERVGDVYSRVLNSKPLHQEVLLHLRDVLLQALAPDNLLSLDLRGKYQLWISQFATCMLVDNESFAVSAIQQTRRYRLPTKTTLVHHVISVQRGQQ